MNIERVRERLKKHEAVIPWMACPQLEQNESWTSSLDFTRPDRIDSREDATLIYGSPGISPDERTLWQTRRKPPKAAR